jgi:hypothetical protein
MQPHQFPYCSRLHLSKTRATRPTRQHTQLLGTADRVAVSKPRRANPVSFRANSHPTLSASSSAGECGRGGAGGWAWRPGPGSLHASTGHSFASAPRAARPRPRKRGTKRQSCSQEAVSEAEVRAGSAAQEAAGSVGPTRLSSGGPNFWNQVAQCASGGALPSRREEDGAGTVAPGGRGGGDSAKRRGQRPPAGYSPRAGAERHSHSASSAHSRAGRRTGIFSVASSSAAAGWADPHEEGVPSEGPRFSPPLFLLLRFPARRYVQKLELERLPSPLLESVAPGSPPQPPPEVWLKLSRWCSEAASCVLPPRPPPPAAKPRPLPPPPRPRRLRHPGVSRRKKRRPELRAEGSVKPLRAPHPLAPAQGSRRALTRSALERRAGLCPCEGVGAGL